MCIWKFLGVYVVLLGFKTIVTVVQFVDDIGSTSGREKCIGLWGNWEVESNNLKEQMTKQTWATQMLCSITGFYKWVTTFCFKLSMVWHPLWLTVNVISLWCFGENVQASALVTQRIVTGCSLPWRVHVIVAGGLTTMNKMEWWLCAVFLKSEMCADVYPQICNSRGSLIGCPTTIIPAAKKCKNVGSFVYCKKKKIYRTVYIIVFSSIHFPWGRW